MEERGLRSATEEEEAASLERDQANAVEVMRTVVERLDTGRAPKLTDTHCL